MSSDEVVDDPAASSFGPPAATRLHGAGVELAADLYGDPGDPPVLLLHGGGQTRHAWGNAAMELAASGRFAISLDLRGHGDSDWAPDGAYDIGSFAEDVRSVVHSIDGTPVLVGASLGGLASLVAVGETREEVASAIVLVDVTPRIEQAGASRIGEFMRSDIGGFDRLEDAADAISRFLPDRPRPKDLSGLRKNLRRREDGRWYWHWDPRFIDNRGGVDGQPGLVDHDRLAAAARHVSVPVLLVRGRMSEIVSDESVRELQQLVPQAEVVDVAGAGHMVAGDRNDAFNEAVVAFVSRVVPL
jgi:pimeloyl-ACP methyl ester carboxylesterase